MNKTKYHWLTFALFLMMLTPVFMSVVQGKPIKHIETVAEIIDYKAIADNKKAFVEMENTGVVTLKSYLN